MSKPFEQSTYTAVVSSEDHEGMKTKINTTISVIKKIIEEEVDKKKAKTPLPMTTFDGKSISTDTLNKMTITSQVNLLEKLIDSALYESDILINIIKCDLIYYLYSYERKINSTQLKFLINKILELEIPEDLSLDTVEIKNGFSQLPDDNSLSSGQHLSKKDFTITEDDGRSEVTVRDLQFRTGEKYYRNMFFSLHFVDDPDPEKPRIFENGADVFANSFNNCAFTDVQFNALKASKFIGCTFTDCSFPRGFGGEFEKKCEFKNINFSEIDPRILRTIRFSPECVFTECKWPAGFSAEEAIRPKSTIPRPYTRDGGVKLALDQIKTPII